MTKQYIKILIGLFITSPCCLSLGSNANSLSYFWPRTPVQLDLTVGMEQSILIPAASVIRLGIPKQIRGKLIPQIIGNQIWVTANEKFARTRVILIAEPLGRIVLEIKSNETESSNQPLIFEQQPQVNIHNNNDTEKHSIGFIALTRWVVQQLYSPQRLLNRLSGVSRVPVSEQPIDIFRCGRRIPTPCSGGIVATPIASWQSPNHYATALNIKNNLPDPIILDPREIRGNWRTAAFVHTILQAEGQIGDSTVLVLISDFPFEQPEI